MVAFTNNGVYVIQYTNIANPKGTISIPKDTVVTSAVDITLIGKSRLNYGEQLDENLLHILENFASFQDPHPAVNGAIQPDLTHVESPIFQHPVEGQFWYNKGLNNGNSIDRTSAGLYVFNKTSVWQPIPTRGLVGANSGVILHGYQIPLPAAVSTYAECAWFVSPQFVDEECNYIACYTDFNANVTALYRSTQDTVIYEGAANYIIIGTHNSSANYTDYAVVPTPTPSSVSTITPTPTPSATHTPAPATSLTPTPTVSLTPSTSQAATLTPTPTHTRTATPAPSITPTPSPLTATIYTLNASLHVLSPGQNYSEYGYFHSSDQTVFFGSMTPVTLNGYPSFKKYEIIGLECYSSNAISPTLGLYLLGAPSNVFTKMTFVDKFGITRTFTPATAISTGGGFFTWAIPQILFNATTAYTILIYP